MNGWPMHNYLSAEAFTANFSRSIGWPTLYAIPAETFIVLAIVA